MNNKQLREARLKMGFTQQQMASKLGVNDKRTYRRWENGEYIIPGTVQKLIPYLLNENKINFKND